MYYSDDVIRQVREANDIVSVISEYVPLKAHGNNYFGLCPFHSEKTGSFSVNARDQFYHCFGCGEGGNVFTFLMKMDNLTFNEAMQNLAERAHIELPQEELSDRDKKELMRKERMREAATEAARFYYAQLTKSAAGAEARAYLERRGVTDEFKVKFGLGFSPISHNALSEYLKKKGYTTEELLGAGLISGTEQQYRDLFFNRLMFPIFDVSGKVIAFGGRVMGDAKPKYLNTNDTIIFNKRRNLYMLNVAKKTRRKELILAEGYMDVLSLHQAGFDNAVASLGTALTPEQCLLIKRYFSDVYLCYDSDEAGTNAARRAIPLLENAGLRVKIIRVKNAKDPDEFIKKFGSEEFEKLIENALNAVEFELMVLNNLEGDSADGQVRVMEGMAARLAQINSDSEREIRIRDVAAKLKISEASLTKDVNDIRSRGGLLEIRTGKRYTGDEENDEVLKGQQLLLAALLQHPEFYEAVRPYITIDLFPEREEPDKAHPDGKPNVYRKVAAYMLEALERGSPPLAADVISLTEEAADQDRVSSLASLTIPEEQRDREKYLTECVRALRKVSLGNQMKSESDLSKLQTIIKQTKEIQNLWISLK